MQQPEIHMLKASHDGNGAQVLLRRSGMVRSLLRYLDLLQMEGATGEKLRHQ